VAQPGAGRKEQKHINLGKEKIQDFILGFFFGGA